MARKKQQAATNGPKVALVYCRVSTKNQEDGTSLDSQAEACVKHAESLGYTVSRVTKEIHSGADLWDRPLLGADRADIRAGKFQALICYAIDRLSRDIAHLAIILEECERAGCELIFVTASLDNSPQGKLLRSVQSYVAEIEIEKIRERTIRGKRGRLLSGKIHGMGHELYGYRRDKERGVRLINEPEARAVRQIFQWINESVASREVVRRLMAMGVPSPFAAKGFSENGWNTTTVQGIIRNPAYKGQTLQWTHAGRKHKKKARAGEPETKSEPILLPEGVTPAIVTPELWQSANDRLTANRGDVKRNISRPYLLRGRITCGKCGRRMYPWRKGQKSPGRRRDYYRCASAFRVEFPRCGASIVPADLCEGWAWQEVSKYLQNPDLIAAELKRSQKQGTDSQLLTDRQIAESALERNVQGQQRLVKRLRHADDALAAIIEQELKQAEKERQILTSTIAELDRRIAGQEQITINLKTLYDYCRDVSRNLKRFNFNQKRLALEVLDVNVIANGRDWKITASLTGVVLEGSC